MRLDLYLTTKKYFESRNKASQAILDGAVSVNNKFIRKPSFDIKTTDVVEIKNNKKQYVARSAKKLITAIKRFNIDFANKVAVDLGATTGGFCEVMLENGVKRIYAVDIGTNQLHSKIKADLRVVNIEHTNARYINENSFDLPVDIVTCDLSFISLKLIIEAVYSVLGFNGEFICLIKPQFELGPQHIGKNGVVRDTELHKKAIKDIINFAVSVGFWAKDVCFSGLSGECGNKEYLLHLIKVDSHIPFDFSKVDKAVMESDK